MKKTFSRLGSLYFIALIAISHFTIRAQSITSRGEWTAPSDPAGATAPATVTIDGNFAYLLSASGYLQIVDITDREHPALLGSTNLTAGIGGAPVGDQTVSYGNYLYAVASGVSGVDVYVVNMTDKAHPTVPGILDIPGAALTVAVNDSRLFVGSVDGLQAYSLSDPAHPQFLGKFDTANWVRKVKVRDNLGRVFKFEKSQENRTNTGGLSRMIQLYVN